jgi:archaetidylinositol phosphate synthase
LAANPQYEPDYASVAEFTPAPPRKHASMQFRPATRVQGSFTAAGEKRALIWMAQRMPAWVNSDHLTALGALGMLLAGASLAASSRWTWAVLAANVFLAVNWFGDSLDGTLARVRNCQRPRYGFYVDHVVDVLGAAALLGGYALSGAMHPLIAAALLVATYCVGEFHMSFWRMGPTELRIALMIGNVALLGRPTVGVLGHRFALFDFGGAIGAAGLVLTFLLAAVRNGRKLYREET